MIYLRLALARGGIKNGSGYPLLNAAIDDAIYEAKIKNVYWKNLVNDCSNISRGIFRFDVKYD